MKILGIKIPDSWNVVAVDDIEIEQPQWLQNAHQETVNMGAYIQDNMLSHVHKCTNPTQSNWFVSSLAYREFDYVANQVGNDLNHVLEIGMRTAGSHVLFKHMSDHVVSVEKTWTDVICSSVLIQTLKCAEGSDFVWGMSSHDDTVDKVHSILPNGVDLLLVDADHEQLDVYADFNCYWSLVKPGGWVWFDDFFSHAGVAPAVKHIARMLNIDMSLAYSESSLQGIAYFQRSLPRA